MNEVTAEDFGDKWPLTVDRGVLACEADGTRKLVTILADRRQYAVNGSAKGSGRFATIDSIWKTQPLGEAKEVATRIAESERRTIFKEFVICEDDNERPEACQAAIRRQHKVSKVEGDQIKTEGGNVPWPPLSPSRVPLQPLIDLGLKLCP